VKPTDEFPVQVYTPQKGDVLVINSEKRLSPDQFSRLQSMMRQQFGKDHKVLVLDKGFSLQIVRENGDLDRWEGEGGR
jgi:hypothetical protein